MVRAWPLVEEFCDIEGSETERMVRCKGGRVGVGNALVSTRATLGKCSDFASLCLILNDSDAGSKQRYESFPWE